MRCLLTLICVLIVLPAVSVAGEVTVRLAYGVEMDDAGRGLREAINRFEERGPLPAEWTAVEVARGESAKLDAHTFLVLSQAPSGAPQLMFIDGSDLHREVLREGEELQLGRLHVIPTELSSDRTRAKLLVRADAPKTAKAIAKSDTKITGHPGRRELTVSSDNDAVLSFANDYLRHLNDGLAASEAERMAIAGFRQPPGGLEAPRGRYVDPTNVMEGRDADFQPLAARVTLRVVRGESTAVRELCSSWEYNNTGRGNSDPPVRVSGGGSGADVSVGGRGDRFRYRLRALEAEGRVNVENETLVRVPLGGSTQFSLGGPRGFMEAWIHAQPRGRNQTELLIDHLEGDWGFLGSISTRVRFRDGQTLPLAQNSYSRSSSSSSGPPIVSGLPYVGPFFGNERSVVESGSYALIATMELE